MVPRKNPFEHFDRTVRQMFNRINSRNHTKNSIFNGSIRRTPYVEQNIDDEKDKLVVTMDIPGVKKEEIDASVKNTGYGDVLMVQVRNNDGARTRSFQNAITLKTKVNEDLADAEYNNGVLTIEFPIDTSETDTGTRIEIN